ncbi:MAG: Do family serine endopeptidase [Phycisphaerales bacterium]|nr:Do family serine endopeptidase [Phycisphaerales bacterium]
MRDSTPNGPAIRTPRGRRLMVLAALAGLAAAPTLLAADTVTFANPDARSNANAGNAMILSNAFRSVAETLRPSVVQIISIDHPPFAGGEGRGARPNRNQIPEQFRDLLPENPRNGPDANQRQPDRMGQGTGVIATADGLVITNNHVIAGADEVKILLHDGRETTATVIGADPATDLAVLRIDASDLVAAKFGDSDESQVGDWVIALGSPFGLSQTVTAGIVSALGREGMGLATFENYIQTDAAINPGNSGGPLANIYGEVIGINSAISSATGGNDGIGFAIPSRMVQRIVNDLATDGTVERGWLGVNIQPLDEELAASFGHDTRSGVLVAGVLDGTPAASAGLEPGDIVLNINGRRTDTPAGLARRIADFTPDTAVSLEFLRNGERLTRTAVLGVRPGSESTTEVEEAPEPETPSLGLELAPLDETMRREAELASETGLFVKGVLADGPAAAAGIEPGDAIIRINGLEPTSIGDFQGVLDGLEPDQTIRLLIERRGMTRFILVETGD